MLCLAETRPMRLRCGRRPKRRAVCQPSSRVCMLEDGMVRLELFGAAKAK